MKKTIKTGVSIDINTIKKLDELKKNLGIKSRSRLISKAIEAFIADKLWMTEKGCVAGALVILYQHDVGNIDREITSIQHDFLDIIKSNTHAHLTHDLCLEVIILHGSIPRVKELISRISNLKGVNAVRHSLINVEDD